MNNMKILQYFDAGALPSYKIQAKGIMFELKPAQVILNVLIQHAPEVFEVDLAVDEQGEGFILNQGLLVSTKGEEFHPVELKKVGEGLLRATVRAVAGEVRLASRHPYGRDALEKLMCKAHAKDGVRWRFLQSGPRGFPMVEFGRENASGLVHYFIAGEDVWETSGSWTADAIVRELHRDSNLTKVFVEDCLVRVVPLASPYSATTSKPSYCTLEGNGIYGAATWGDDPPPPEYAMIRELVESSILESRLGLFMTIHSWQAQLNYSGLETIKSAGGNTLPAERAAWATDVMERILLGVPLGEHALADKIWHKGLARDYLLARHNAVTFRIEVTTAGQGHDGFRESGRRMVANLFDRMDWRHVLPGK